MLHVLVSLSLALPPTLPVAEVAAGQKGQCLTVFEGEAIEPFDFVVKGVMHNYLGPGRDVVLIRLLGDKPEFTGVVAGMSGSPCSINGRLVGALAYAFATFAKEPIAGIQPIASMLEVNELPDQSRPWRLLAANDADWRSFRDGTAGASASDPAGLVPIATPLSFGGAAPVVLEHFAPWFTQHGFVPVAGAGRAKGGGPRALQPGSAVSAVLVQGDVDVSATGTVTVVHDGDVLAFGHPFMGAGPISVPMATAEILNTMVSALRSHKMSALGTIVGEITQDRLTAIGGKLGKLARMIPVKGTMRTPTGEDSFELRVARDYGLSPRFVAVGLASALQGRVDDGVRGTVRVEGSINMAGLDPIPIHEVYSAQRDRNMLMYAAVDVAEAFNALWSTPFGPPPEIAVSVRASVELEPHEEWIEDVYVDRERARPGEPVQVAVRLRKLHGGLHVERFVVQVPRAWAGQNVEIVAAAAESAERLDREVGGDPRPTDVRQIGRWLARRRPDGQLYLLAVRPGAGLQAEVDSMPFLPPSAIATLSGEPTRQAMAKGLAWEERRARPGVVYGQARAAINVTSY